MRNHRSDMFPGLYRFAFIMAIGFACGSTSLVGQATTQPSLLDELRVLVESRDYFSLRERLKMVPDEAVGELRLLKAKSLNAFNRPRESNETLTLLLKDDSLNEDLSYQIHSLRMRNHIRLHEYRPAAEAGRAALRLAGSQPQPGKVSDLRTSLHLVEALSDVPPQTHVVRGETVLPIRRGRIPVRIGGMDREYVLDTGANYSVLMQSEAEAIGLKILDVNLEVGTSTDLKVTADLTVADSLTIGAAEFRHVVFLVFPDEVLTINEQVRLDGIIGFPVLEAMGELRFGPNGVLKIPARVPKRTEGNLALDELVPLVRVGYDGHLLVCRLDTGANHTQGYEPFYRRFQKRIEAQGVLGEIKTGGVGGIRTLEAYTLNELSLTIAGRVVRLNGIDVLTNPISDPDDNYLYLNIGRDVLREFDSYIINFRDMALVLE